MSPSSIAINWNLLQSNHCEVFLLLGFRVFYSFNNKENSTVTHSVNVNKSINNVVIQDLENFEYYLIWVQTITSRDLGPKSKAVKTRTLEQGKSCYWFGRKEFSFSLLHLVEDKLTRFTWGENIKEHIGTRMVVRGRFWKRKSHHRIVK